MSKEYLEALEILKKHNSKSTSERYYYPVNTRRNAVNIIEQALQRLKEIDNAKPSEALECLESLRQECKSTYFDENKKQWWTTDKNKDYRCNTIKQALIKAQEQEKVLKIIFEKNVDIEDLKWCINNPKKLTTPLLNYNIDRNKNDQLTKEEFELIKRWLENEKN